MNTQNKSSRTSKKIACKDKYPELFHALEDALDRYRGGYKTMASSTSVCASTLRNQIDGTRTTDNPTLCTFLDTLKALRGRDPFFADYFKREFLVKEADCNCGKVDMSDVLHLIKQSSKLSSVAISAIEDGEVDSDEIQQIKEAALLRIEELKSLVAKIAGSES